MDIAQKLKEARKKSGLTQEAVAEAIKVSRQSISNWENGRTYPDIVSILLLSDLYGVSLDELLKGDEKMTKHFEENMDVVSSNKKLILAIGLNSLLLILALLFNSLLDQNVFVLLLIFCLAILSTAMLFYQIIRKF